MKRAAKNVTGFRVITWDPATPTQKKSSSSRQGITAVLIPMSVSVRSICLLPQVATQVFGYLERGLLGHPTRYLRMGQILTSN